MSPYGTRDAPRLAGRLGDLMAVGAGVSFAALMTLAMSGATRADAGLASGPVNTTMLVGGAVGLTVAAVAVAALVLEPAGEREATVAARATQEPA